MIIADLIFIIILLALLSFAVGIALKVVAWVLVAWFLILVVGTLIRLFRK